MYQKALNYIDFVYDPVLKLPKEEKYNLVDQFRRASASIALNIGEAAGGTEKEFIAFLQICKRSVKECVVCTTVLIRRNYISAVEESESRRRLVELVKMNDGLSRSIKRKFEKNKEPLS